jgi:flagellar basal body-associated protein FliL
MTTYIEPKKLLGIKSYAMSRPQSKKPKTLHILLVILFVLIIAVSAMHYAIFGG